MPSNGRRQAASSRSCPILAMRARIARRAHARPSRRAWVADLLTAAGVDRVLAMDLHAGQIQGFFNIPVDHIFAMPVMMDYLRTKFSTNSVIVSPDAGGVERARAYSKRLDTSLAIIDKRRPAPNVAELVNIIGDVNGRDAIIVDDLVDTAGTLVCRRPGSHQVRRAFRLRLRHARPAVGPGTGAHPRQPDQRDHHHRFHPSPGRHQGLAQSSGPLGLRASWERQSSASTRGFVEHPLHLRERKHKGLHHGFRQGFRRGSQSVRQGSRAQDARGRQASRGSLRSPDRAAVAGARIPSRW